MAFFFFSLPSYAKFTVSDYAEKTQRRNKQTFCLVALCILYVLNLLLNGSENIKPFSVLCLHFTYSCSVISPSSSFLWKCHSVRAAQRSETYSIPHSLLLYSVHVKWILICVQNVIKMKIHLIIYFVHSCPVCWFISLIYGELRQLHAANVNLLPFKVSAGMGCRGDSSGSECCFVFGARHAAVNISKTADLWGF